MRNAECGIESDFSHSAFRIPHSPFALMRRVLILSHTYVEPATRGKLEALAARDLDVTVGVPQRWREPVLGRQVETTWERQSGLEVFPIPAGPPGDVAEYRFGRRELVSLIRDKRPDLIHIEEEPMAAATRQACRVASRLKTPVVLFTRDSAEHGKLGWRRRRILRQAKGVVAASGATAEVIRNAIPDLPVAVVPQLGVHVPPAPTHLPHQGLAVGYVGRLVMAKGLDTLLAALAVNRASNWQLIVVGDGPDRERLEALASELRLAARIRWAGGLPPDQLERVWHGLDLLVLPARDASSGAREPLVGGGGQVLAEAMAHEVAVVGTRTGMIPDVIGDAGVIVPPDDAAALAVTLRELERDETRAPLAQAARARAMQHFSDDAVA